MNYRTTRKLLDMQVLKMSSKSSLSKTRIIMLKNRHAYVLPQTKCMVWLTDSQSNGSDNLESLKFSSVQLLNCMLNKCLIHELKPVVWFGLVQLFNMNACIF